MDTVCRKSIASVAIFLLCTFAVRAQQVQSDSACAPPRKSDVQLATTTKFQVLSDMKYPDGRVRHSELVVDGAKAYRRAGSTGKYQEKSFLFHGDDMPKGVTYAGCNMVRSEQISGRIYDVYDYNFSFLPPNSRMQQELRCNALLDHQTELPLKRECTLLSGGEKYSSISGTWTYRQDIEGQKLAVAPPPF